MHLSRGSPLSHPSSRTFVLAVAGGVLTVLNQDLGCRVQGDGLRFGDQEQHDKLLAHDAQRLVFPVASSYEREKKNQTIVTGFSVVLILRSLTSLTVTMVAIGVLPPHTSLRGLHTRLHVEVVALPSASLLQLLQRGLQALPAIPGVAVLRYPSHDGEGLEHVHNVIDAPTLYS